MDRSKRREAPASLAHGSAPGCKVPEGPARFSASVYVKCLRAAQICWLEKRSVLACVSIDAGMQGSSPDIDSSRFYESMMVELQDSVSRTMPGYEFDRAFCTLPRNHFGATVIQVWHFES